MNKVILGGVSALALLAVASTAQAQQIPEAQPSQLTISNSISDRVGSALIGLNDGRGFATGNYLQESYNIGTVDASVRSISRGVVGAIDLQLPSVDADLEIAAGGGLSAGIGALLDAVPTLTLDQLLGAGVITPEGINIDALNGLLAELGLGAGLDVEAILAAAVAGEVGVGVDLGRLQANINTAGNFNVNGVLKTSAIGSVQTGSLAIAPTTLDLSTDNSVSNVDGAVSDVEARTATAAANTSNTASAATAGLFRDNSVGQSSSNTNDIRDRVESGLDGVYAAQRSYNAGNVYANVALAVGSVNGIATDTSAIGSVQTGNLSAGFDGSALVQQIQDTTSNLK